MDVVMINSSPETSTTSSQSNQYFTFKMGSGSSFQLSGGSQIDSSKLNAQYEQVQLGGGDNGWDSSDDEYDRRIRAKPRREESDDEDDSMRSRRSSAAKTNYRLSGS